MVMEEVGPLLYLCVNGALCGITSLLLRQKLLAGSFFLPVSEATDALSTSRN